MAEPEIKYEYGRTPEDEQGGIWPLLSQFGGLFTPERREVVKPLYNDARIGGMI